MKPEYSQILNRTTSILFATFSHYENGHRLRINGMIESLLSFLLPKVHSIHMVVQPHPGSDRINPEVELYENGAVQKSYVISSWYYLLIYIFCVIPKKRLIRLSYKLRDIFSVLFVAFNHNEHYDFFIGLEAINLLAGLLLKKLGYVKKTIYYVSDYSPRRFQNAWFNALYVRLDRFALTHADYTWDVSQAMQPGRIEAGLIDRGSSYRVIHVPNALFPSQIASLPIQKRNRNDLVYMGVLQSDMGPDLALQALKEVKKHFPHMRLHIIGGPKAEEQQMKLLAAKLGLIRSVLFHGFVPDDKKMAHIIRKCYIGLAPYRSFPNSKRWYGDAGKIRQYMAAGLPIVTTHVPPLGREVVQRGAGIMVKDTVQYYSNGIIRLLSNDRLYAKLAARAVSISRNNTWEHTYTKAFSEMANM